MGMIVEVQMSIKAPDGTPQVAALQADLTVNPIPNDFQHEADVAEVTLDALIDGVREQLKMRLQDWSLAMAKIHGGDR